MSEETLITKELLLSLGSYANGDGYTLPSRDYTFHFRQDGPSWEMTSVDSLISHTVTHIEECFGFIAEDFHRFGHEEKEKEFRECLGIRLPEGR